MCKHVCVCTCTVHTCRGHKITSDIISQTPFTCFYFCDRIVCWLGTRQVSYNGWSVNLGDWPVFTVGYNGAAPHQGFYSRTEAFILLPTQKASPLSHCHTWHMSCPQIPYSIEGHTDLPLYFLLFFLAYAWVADTLGDKFCSCCEAGDNSVFLHAAMLVSRHYLWKEYSPHCEWTWCNS